MKRYFYIIVVLFLMFINSSVNAKGIDIKSKEAILYNLNDNSIIYEKNSNNITIFLLFYHMLSHAGLIFCRESLCFNLVLYYYFCL